MITDDFSFFGFSIFGLIGAWSANWRLEFNVIYEKHNEKQE